MSPKAEESDPKEVEPQSQFLPTIIEDDHRDLVQAEENIWATLAALKAQEPSWEVNNSIKDAYVALAEHYAFHGGHQSAAGFLQNALERVDDPRLKHALARIQASSGGLEFVSSFTALLKSHPYNLPLALEFCFFLERRGLHAAALGTFEEELKKRIVARPHNDLEDSSLLSGFLSRIQFAGAAGSQSKILDYQQVIKENFPSEVFTASRVRACLRRIPRTAAM